MTDIKLKPNEMETLDDFKRSLEYNIKNIERVLEANRNGEPYNKWSSDFDDIWTDQVRGLEVITDYNVLWNTRNKLQDMFERIHKLE